MDALRLNTTKPRSAGSPARFRQRRIPAKGSLGYVPVLTKTFPDAWNGFLYKRLRSCLFFGFYEAYPASGCRHFPYRLNNISCSNFSPDFCACNSLIFATARNDTNPACLSMDVAKNRKPFPDFLFLYGI